jgi:DNA-binding transcriptional ArsR family regulator
MEMIEDSYDLVVSKLPMSPRRALNWNRTRRSSSPLRLDRAQRTETRKEEPRPPPVLRLNDCSYVVTYGDMPHPSEHRAAGRLLGEDEASELAATLKAIGSPSRLRLLTELLDSERAVEELASAAGLSVSATSHHLRILRDLRLVRGRRDGRHVRYGLHDHHIVDLLAAVRHHREHVHPPAPEALPRPRVRGSA